MGRRLEVSHDRSERLMRHTGLQGVHRRRLRDCTRCDEAATPSDDLVERNYRIASTRAPASDTSTRTVALCRARTTSRTFSDSDRIASTSGHDAGRGRTFRLADSWVSKQARPTEFQTRAGKTGGRVSGSRARPAALRRLDSDRGGNRLANAVRARGARGKRSSRRSSEARGSRKRLPSSTSAEKPSGHGLSAMRKPRFQSLTETDRKPLWQTDRHL
jgi:hypothetical protein